MSGTAPLVIDFPRFEPWRFLTYAAMVIVETCWIIPWFELLPAEKPPGSSLVMLLVFGGILSVSVFVFRLEADLHIRKDLRPWVSAGLIVLSLLLAIKALVYLYSPLSLAGMLEHIGAAINGGQPGIPTEFYVFLFVFLAVFRSSTLARGGVDPSTVLDHFRLGLLMSFGAGLLSALTSRTAAGQFGFFAGLLLAGLAGMSMARLMVLGQRRGGQSIPFDRSRLVAVLAPASALVFAALGLALLLGSPIGIRLLSGIGILFQLLLGGIIALTGLLLSPVAVLIVYLFSVLTAGIHKAPLPNPTQNMDDTLRNWEKLIGQQAATLNPAIRPILLWGTILIIFVIIVLAARARVYRMQEAGLQEVDSLLSGKGLLRKMWKDLRNLTQMGGLKGDQRRVYAARIRKIYADLLDLAASLEAARPASRTPLEYLPDLSHVFPGYQPELETITQAYLGVRYGEYPETPEQVDQIETAWKRLEISTKEQARRSRRKR